jgi:hypothetical protein
VGDVTSDNNSKYDFLMSNIMETTEEQQYVYCSRVLSMTHPLTFHKSRHLPGHGAVAKLDN